MTEGKDEDGGDTAIPAPLSATQMATLAYPVFNDKGEPDTTTSTLTQALVQQVKTSLSSLLCRLFPVPSPSC